MLVSSQDTSYSQFAIQISDPGRWKFWGAVVKNATSGSLAGIEPAALRFLLYDGSVYSYVMY